jgi:hypothetical protein
VLNGFLQFATFAYHETNVSFSIKLQLTDILDPNIPHTADYKANVIRNKSLLHKNVIPKQCYSLIKKQVGRFDAKY